MPDGGVSQQITDHVLGAVDDATTDSLHGKIGTQTEMANASLYDRLLPTQWQVKATVLTNFTSTVLGTIASGKLVEFQVFGICNAAITGTLAETVQVDFIGLGTDNVIAATTATAIVAREIWWDASPDVDIEDSSQITSYFAGEGAINFSQNGTDAWDTGSVTMIVRWRPVIAGSTVA